MINILPEEYIAHHMLLVEAVATLLQSSISRSMLRKTEGLIKHYCFKFSFYYSERYMTANLHHLLHLPEVVFNFGPLFTYSCFPFESQNGKLLKFVKGTQYVDLQIIESIALTQKLPQIAEEVLSLENEALALSCHGWPQNHPFSKIQEIKEEKQPYSYIRLQWHQISW